MIKHLTVKEREALVFEKMKDTFHYKNAMAAPKIKKVVINTGTGTPMKKDKNKKDKKKRIKCCHFLIFHFPPLPFPFFLPPLPTSFHLFPPPSTSSHLFLHFYRNKIICSSVNNL